MVANGLDRSIVVTTAPGVSRHAKKEAENALRHNRLYVGLIDFPKLRELLRLTAPRAEPWKDLVQWSGFG